MRSKVKRVGALVLVMLLSLGCGAVQLAEQPTLMSVPPSYWPTDGWRTSTPEEQGMDSETLAKMFETIQEQEYNIDSVTVIRNGYMVADAAVYPFKPDSRHIIHSCTKSIVSALIGIAIDEGYIESVNQPILDIFSERTVANLDSDKEAMTLEHMLMMASGLECRDSYLYRWRGLREMERSDDWVQFVLDLPMAESPGTRFEYCNGASFLLSAIVQETTGIGSLQIDNPIATNPDGTPAADPLYVKIRETQTSSADVIENLEDITLTPEPATLALLAAGGLGLLARRRRRR